MNLLGLTIARTDTIEALIDERAAQVLDRYAHNPKALRAGLVAYNSMFDAESIPDGSPLLGWMSRAVIAFAKSVEEQRLTIRFRPTPAPKPSAPIDPWPTCDTPSVLQFFPASAQGKSRPLSGSEAETSGRRESLTSRLPGGIPGRAAA